VRALLTVLLLLVVFACASSPPLTEQHFTAAPPPPPGYATLYIYRGFRENGSAVWPIVNLNDVKVADIKTRSYTYVYIWPGHYHLHAGKSFVLMNWNVGEEDSDFDIPSAGTYYLQFGSEAPPNQTLYVAHTFVTLSPGGEFGWFLRSESFAQPILSKTQFQPAYVQTVGHQ
jgi:hypothetical protein